MGCDIHGCVERNVNGKWVMVDRISDKARDRNYRRFGALAGVREYGPPPKGIPGDISDSGKLFIDEWGEDGHSHSYLPLKTAANIFLSTEFKASEYMKNYPCATFFNIEDFDENIDLYRLVFWFDN